MIFFLRKENNSFLFFYSVPKERTDKDTEESKDFIKKKKQSTATFIKNNPRTERRKNAYSLSCHVCALWSHSTANKYAPKTSKLNKNDTWCLRNIYNRTIFYTSIHLYLSTYPSISTGIYLSIVYVYRLYLYVYS